MKKGKILSISSALCLGTTLFAAVSCTKETTAQNQNTILKVSTIDLSKDENYKNKFAINDENLGIVKNKIIEIIQSNKENLFSNLISDSNLNIKDLVWLKDEGKISVYVELDKYKNEQGKIVTTPKTFEVKLIGLKKDGLTTYIDYDDSHNKGIDLGKLNSEIKTQKASEWIKEENKEKAKQVLLEAIKQKIKNIASAKEITSITNQDVEFGELKSDDDKGLVYVEITFKDSIWWVSGVAKEFKTTINFSGFKTSFSIDQGSEEKNTKAIVNEKVLTKIEDKENDPLYQYFSDEFKDIKIELNQESGVEQYQAQLKSFIKSKEMFIHNFEDNNIEIKNIQDNGNETNKENIKKGFFDFKVVFKKQTPSTSKTETNEETNTENNTTSQNIEFKLRFSGFKVEDQESKPKNIQIESSKWIMKNNIVSGENKDKFYYGIKVILKGDFSENGDEFSESISAILKYSETNVASKIINLSLYIIERNDKDRVTLFFTHNDWNDTNYPNGGQIFDKSEIIVNVPGFNSVQSTIVGGIDEFEVQKVSANSAVFNKKTYYYLSIDLYSPLGNLPAISSEMLSKDYVIKLQKNNGDKAEIDARAYISFWHMGQRATLFALFDDGTEKSKFDEYKKGTNISIKIPGFKIKNVYFEENKNNQFSISSAKWNKDNEKYFVEVELKTTNSNLPKTKEEYEVILESSNARLNLKPFDIQVKDDKNVIVKLTYSKWYLSEIGQNQENLSLAYIIVKVAGFNYVEYMENINSNNIKPN